MIINVTADTIDGLQVTTNESVVGGYINDVFFRRFVAGDETRVGSGVFIKMFSMQEIASSNDAENGFNRLPGTPSEFETKSPLGASGDLRVSNLVESADGLYYVFGLDGNENQSPIESYFSLDDLRLYTSPTNPTVNPEYVNELDRLGTLRYDMNPGDLNTNIVLIDSDLTSGSGKTTDLLVFVKKSLFEGAAASDYLFLYSSLGQYQWFETNRTDFHTEATFEEWALPVGLTTPLERVPEPSAFLAALAGTLAVFGIRVARSRARSGQRRA